MNYINSKIVKSDSQWTLVYSEAFQRDFVSEVTALCRELAQAFSNKQLKSLCFDYTATKVLKVVDLLYLVECILQLQQLTNSNLAITIKKYKPLMDLAKLYDLNSVLDKHIVF